MIMYMDKPVNISTPGASYETGSVTIPQSELALECVQSPHGFIVTAFAFEEFLTYNSLHLSLHCIMQSLDTKEYSNLSAVAHTAQALLLSAKMPPNLQRAIINAYHDLGIDEPVTVDSHNIIINEVNLQEDTKEPCGNSKTLVGGKNVLAAVQNCFAELYAGEAIKYRQDHNCVHDKAALSITVQTMKRLPRSTRLQSQGYLIDSKALIK